MGGGDPRVLGHPIKESGEGGGGRILGCAHGTPGLEGAPHKGRGPLDLGGGGTLSFGGREVPRPPQKGGGTPECRRVKETPPIFWGAPKGIPEFGGAEEPVRPINEGGPPTFGVRLGAGAPKKEWGGGWRWRGGGPRILGCIWDPPSLGEPEVPRQPINEGGTPKFGGGTSGTRAPKEQRGGP